MADTKKKTTPKKAPAKVRVYIEYSVSSCMYERVKGVRCSVVQGGGGDARSEPIFLVVTFLIFT